MFDSASAQLTMDHQNKDVTPPTTEAYNLNHYGQVGCSLYTGTISLDIPFYTYEDKDFKLPISFSYASNGYMPNSRPVVLGPGWNLAAGGTISREVKGIPDEKNVFYNIEPNHGVDIHGYQRFYINKGSSDSDDSTINPSISKQDGTVLFYRTLTSKNENYELEPDIFHFNFLGYSGSFQMWENGEIKLFGNGKSLQQIKVDINSPDLSSITLTTGDGYKYLFGHTGVESVITSTPDTPGITQTTHQSWRLHQIISPNGRKITFNYSILEFPENRYEGKYYMFSPQSTKNFNIFSAGTSSSNHALGVNTTRYKSYPLTSISIDNGPLISFSYLMTSGEKRYHSLLNNGVMDAGITPRLNEVNVTYNTDTIAHCCIDYKIVSSGVEPTNNTIYFPQNIMISGEGTYSFNYDSEVYGGFPPFGTHAVDAWGYYNGSYENTARQFLANGLSYDDTTLDETVNSAYRYSNHVCTFKGMLTKVTYPTGGYTEIEYEPNAIGAQVIRNSSTEYLPDIRTIPTAQTGGLRVKSITNYAYGDETGRTTSYSYTSADGGSSGILLSTPRYGVKYYARGNGFNSYVEYYSLHDVYQYSGTNVEYGRVTETLPDNSKKIYEYTTWQDYSDKCEQSDALPLPRFVFDSNNTIGYLTYFTITSGQRFVKNMLTPVVSMQTMRGQLKSLTTQDCNNMIVNRQTWSIRPKNILSTSRIAILGEYYSLVPYELYTSEQISSTEIFTYQGNNISSSVYNSYNNRGQLSFVKKINSNDETEVTAYLYPEDFSNNPVCAAMIEKNMLDFPISVKIYKRQSASDSTLISEMNYTYRISNDNIVLSKVHQYDIKRGSNILQTDFIKYDSLGNLLESAETNGIHSTYIWGYNGLHMIAKIENAKHSDIASIVGNSPLPGCLSTEQISSIKANCPNADITTYEYKPLVGVSKIVNPNGETFTYKYNESGKLMGIYNSKGEKVEEALYSTDNKQ